MSEVTPIVIPLRRPADLPRVGEVARMFAEALGRPIEILTILHPNDDLSLESARFQASVDEFSQAIGQPVALSLEQDEAPIRCFLDHCRDRWVCMATGASPFDDAHYVGSFAAALLAETTAPVILVGPRVEADTLQSIERVVLGLSSEVDASVSQAVAHDVAIAFGCPIAKVRVDGAKGIVYESDCHDPKEWFPEEVHATLRAEAVAPEDVCHVLVERSTDAVLVMATRAHRGLAWICEGSVAFGAISHTKMPVVAVGPNARPQSVA